MATFPDLDAALYTKLAAASAITSLVSTKIYESQAPADTALPYLLFYFPTELNVDTTPRDVINAVCRVEGIAASRSGAKGIVLAADSVLHNSNLTITGWSNYALVWMEHIRLPVENINGKQHHRMVSEYRVKIARDN